MKQIEILMKVETIILQQLTILKIILLLKILEKKMLVI